MQEEKRLSRAKEAKGAKRKAMSTSRLRPLFSVVLSGLASPIFFAHFAYFARLSRFSTAWIRFRVFHFPMQNWLKIESSKSSVEVFPTISPTAFAAIRKSIATSSNVSPLAKASVARLVAVRARASASW